MSPGHAVRAGEIEDGDVEADPRRPDGKVLLKLKVDGLIRESSAHVPVVQKDLGEARPEEVAVDEGEAGSGPQRDEGRESSVPGEADDAGEHDPVPLVELGSVARVVGHAGVVEAEQVTARGGGVA
jgi:hypothetical protein